MCEYLAIELLHIRHKDRVVVASLASLCEYPVRNTAIAYFAMAERTKTQHHRNILLGTKFYEMTKVALSAPVEDAFLFFYMIPEHIGGNHRYPTLFHLLYLLSPFGFRNTRIVYLAHHRHHSMAIHNKAVGIPRNFGLQGYADGRRSH